MRITAIRQLYQHRMFKVTVEVEGIHHQCMMTITAPDKKPASIDISGIDATPQVANQIRAFLVAEYLEGRL